MAIPDKLVQAAAEAVRVAWVEDDTSTLIYNHDAVARIAIAAAFAALPEWIESEMAGSIISGVHPQWFAGFDYAIAYLAEKARS